MSDTVEIKRETAWWSLVIQIPIMVLLILLLHEVAGLRPWPFAAISGAAIYLLWSRLSKAYALRFHRRGIQRMREGQFEEAAEEFSQSYRWFTEHIWLDRHRFSLLLDSSARCYREMALVNEATAVLASGSAEDANRLYKKALEVFPASEMARAGQGECERVLAKGNTI